MTKTIFYLLIIAFASGCSTAKSTLQATYNKGGYEINSYRNKSLAAADSVIIIGKIAALDNSSSLVAPTIRYGCTTQQSTTGEYKLRTTAADVKLQLTATAVGYLAVETAPIITQAGDSIIVNFYLSPDERPLLNCEGSLGVK